MLFYFPMIIWAGLLKLAQEEMRRPTMVAKAERRK
jgi:hypothetical protein